MLLGKKHFRTGNNNYADISKYFGIKYNLMAYPQSLNYIKLLSLKKLPVFFFFFLSDFNHSSLTTQHHIAYRRNLVQWLADSISDGPVSFYPEAPALSPSFRLPPLLRANVSIFFAFFPLFNLTASRDF